MASKMIHAPMAGLKGIQLSGYIGGPAYQGYGRYVPQCARITLKFCKTYENSRGLREFIEVGAVDFARRNPSTVLYLKPRRHRSPVLVAEYLSGHREWKPLSKMNSEEIGWWLDWFVTRRGDPVMEHLKLIQSANPSIQGMWTPYTNTPTSWAVGEFPNEEASRFIPDRPSATEQLVRIAEEQGIQWPQEK